MKKREGWKSKQLGAQYLELEPFLLWQLSTLPGGDSTKVVKTMSCESKKFLLLQL